MASLTPAAMRSLIVPQLAKPNVWATINIRKRDRLKHNSMDLIVQPFVAESKVRV